MQTNKEAGRGGPQCHGTIGTMGNPALTNWALDLP